MNVRFLKIAELELDETIEYYEGQQEVLGNRWFLIHVESAAQRIAQFPNAFNPLSKRTRFRLR